MEFPDLGEHCNEPTCKKFDFLPVKCDACGKIFCSDHMTYEQHTCPSALEKDIKVPICPLCGVPVPTPRNEKPDVTVSEHIDKDCQSDPAKARKTKNFHPINAHKCSLHGCKTKEMMPVICGQCRKNYCLVHRFPDVHNCEKMRSRPLEAALRRQQDSSASHIRAVQGSMSEDEALARALSESMKESDRYMGQHSGNRQQTESNQVNPQRCQVS